MHGTASRSGALPAAAAGVAALVQRRIGLDMAQPGMVRRLASVRPLPQVERLDAEGEDTPAWQALLDKLLVPETYLFRNAGQFELMLQSGFVPDAPGERTLRLWSAGCCTGEEAFTLASLAVRALCAAGHACDDGAGFALLDGWRIDVVGTDVSRSALDRAAAGLYPTGTLSAFRAIPDAELRYFPLAGPARRMVRADLRALVRFQLEGLLRPHPPVTGCDLVACRNVLFYLTDAARSQVLDLVCRAVRPGGLLALGPADPPPDPARFTTIWGPDAVIYRRRP